MNIPITDLTTRVEKNGEILTLKQLWDDFERLHILDKSLKGEDVICLTASNYSDKKEAWTKIMVEFQDNEFKGNDIRKVIDFIENREL